jgi:uncharacterized protein YejL (UPF0352 family)
MSMGNGTNVVWSYDGSNILTTGISNQVRDYKSGETNIIGSAVSLAKKVVSECSCTKDAYVDFDNPATNYGGETTGFAFQAFGEFGIRYTFFEFDLSDIPADAEIISIGLKLKVLTQYTNPTEVNLSTCGNFVENTITYNNKPADTYQIGGSGAGGTTTYVTNGVTTAT